MFLASFLIGLREGLEAALVVGIIIAYITQVGRTDAKKKIWWGIASAVLITAAISAASTFGRSRLTFQAQEIIGGSMSLLAVVMVTWMVFWMMKMGKQMAAEVRHDLDRALAVGSGTGVFWLAFVTVGREGVETTLMLWGWVGEVLALVGALLGIAAAVFLGWALYRGMVQFHLGTFFSWSGAFLIVMCAGILAYGIHDLQEAAVLPGPFSGSPITPTHPRTGEVLTGFAAYPFWGAAYPFGWAFDFGAQISETSFFGSLLKGTIGFTPQMTWLEVTAWFVYLVAVVPAFIRRVRALHAQKRDARIGSAETTTSVAESQPTQTSAAELPRVAHPITKE